MGEKGHSGRVLLGLTLVVLSLGVLLPAGGASAATFTWTQRLPANNPPESSGRPLMAYDTALHELVLVQDGTTWTYDGSNWTEQHPTAGTPEASALAYDAQTGKIVVLVPNGATNPLQTYTYDGTNWAKQSITGPTFRVKESMAYDSATGKIVMFGGAPTTLGFSTFSDTWVYDGSSWTQQDITGPKARMQATMAYDPALSKIVLFGGVVDVFGTFSFSDTWTYDGSKWTQAQSAAPFGQVTDVGLAYDPTVDQFLLFGGSDSAVVHAVLRQSALASGNTFTDSLTPNATWVLGGSGWRSQATEASPPGSEAPAMAYDPVIGQVVLVSGGLTWSYGPELDPTTTTLVCTPSSPTTQQCEASVSDVASSGSPATGTVTFSSTDGTFTPDNKCTPSITAGASSPSCAVTLSGYGAGTVTVTGAYSGDPYHAPSSASVGHNNGTTTTAACSRSQTYVGLSTLCTATVTDRATGAPTAPPGTVTFSSGGSGSFDNNVCNLSGSGSTSSCQVSYTPAAVGSSLTQLTATYAPSDSHQPSSATTSLTILGRGTSTSVSCAPAVVHVGSATTCQATVSDNTLGTPSTPTGTVSFNSVIPGGFGGNPCTLTATPATGTATCQVTFTPRKGALLASVDTTYNGDTGHAVGVGTGGLSVIPQGASSKLLTSGEHAFQVPAGTTRILVSATGGQGGGGYGSNCEGGAGAQLTATIPVTPGQTLYVEVGGHGGDDTQGGANSGTAGANGGGTGGGGLFSNSGGGGGGASDIRTSPASAGLSPSSDPRLLVAGGGGGGGQAYPGCSGGDAGATAQAGSASATGGSGGGAGTKSTGGSAGASANDPANPNTNVCAAASAGGLGSGGNGGGTGMQPCYAGGGGGGGYYGGGGGGYASIHAPGAAGSGGGAGSSYLESSATDGVITTAPQSKSMSIGPSDGQVLLIYGFAPPTASIASPATGATYAVGQHVSSSFRCAEGTGGSGLQYCRDSTGHGGTSGKFTGALDTRSPGRHSYFVVAVSTDGLSRGARINYTVKLEKPANITRPSISGTLAVGKILTCNPGTWTGGPTFSYRWSRNGTALAGATTRRYRVHARDQGAKLTCTVTARNAVGSATANSRPVTVPHAAD
jgi:Glycine rich protein